MPDTMPPPSGVMVRVPGHLFLKTDAGLAHLRPDSRVLRNSTERDASPVADSGPMVVDTVGCEEYTNTHRGPGVGEGDGAPPMRYGGGHGPALRDCACTILSPEASTLGRR